MWEMYTHKIISFSVFLFFQYFRHQQYTQIIVKTSWFDFEHTSGVLTLRSAVHSQILLQQPIDVSTVVEHADVEVFRTDPFENRHQTWLQVVEEQRLTPAREVQRQNFYDLKADKKKLKKKKKF